jgi:hypothetical protein
VIQDIFLAQTVMFRVFNSRNKYFLENARENNKLFFVGRNTGCKICAFAVFKSITPSNIDYNWILHGPDDNGRWKNSKWDLEMIYTDYCDLRAINSSIVNTNIVNKNPNGIMPRSIVDNCGFDFDNLILFIENYKMYLKSLQCL